MNDLLSARSQGTCTDRKIISELCKTCCLDDDGARAILAYFAEQHALMGMLPSHRRIVVEAELKKDFEAAIAAYEVAVDMDLPSQSSHIPRSWKEYLEGRGAQ